MREDLFRWLWAMARLIAHGAWLPNVFRGCRMMTKSYWMECNPPERVARRDWCSCGKEFYKSRAYDTCTRMFEAEKAEEES